MKIEEAVLHDVSLIDFTKFYQNNDLLIINIFLLYWTNMIIFK